MKKLLTLFILISNTAFAGPSFELPKGETCRTLYGVKSFNANPQFLNEYEKCWLARWRPNETQGQFNNKLWIKIENQYFSIHRDSLRFLRKDQAKMVFNREIHAQVLAWKQSQQTKEN